MGTVWRRPNRTSSEKVTFYLQFYYHSYVFILKKRNNGFSVRKWGRPPEALGTPPRAPGRSPGSSRSIGDAWRAPCELRRSSGPPELPHAVADRALGQPGGSGEAG